MKGRRKIYFYRSPIRKAAIAAGLTSDTAIAARTNLTQSTVSRFFKSGSCSESTIVELAKLFALDVDRLRDNSRTAKQQSLFPE